MERKCKNCILARFPYDRESAARKWTGVCAVGGQTVQQHFRCSNNKYQPIK